MKRRNLLMGLAGAGGFSAATSISIGLATLGSIGFPSEGCACLKELDKWCGELEARTGQRIGVYDLSVNSNYERGHRWNERFAMCSTFKWVLAAAVLKGVADGAIKLDQPIKYTKADLLDYAPIVKANLSKGALTVSELCAAAVSFSDNSAANLLFPRIGGPEGLTGFVRSLGDEITRFDRNEPSLNSNLKGDHRDTTTPKAMAHLLRKVFSGSVLSGEALSLLKGWMVAATTGHDLIRSQVIEELNTVVGDKTGRGANGALNDVAVVWRGQELSEIVCIYTSGGWLSDADAREVFRGVAGYVFSGG